MCLHILCSGRFLCFSTQFFKVFSFPLFFLLIFILSCSFTFAHSFLFFFAITQRECACWNPALLISHISPQLFVLFLFCCLFSLSSFFFLFFHSIFHFPFLWISVLHFPFAGHAGPHFKLRFVFLLMRIFSFFFTKQSTRSQMKRFSFFSPPFLLDIFSSSHLLAEHEHKSPSSTPLHEHEHIRVLPTNQLTIKIVASHILIIPAPFLGSFLHEDDPNHLEEEKNTQKERKKELSFSQPTCKRSLDSSAPSFSEFC